MSILFVLFLFSLVVIFFLLKLLFYRGQKAENLLRIYSALHGDIGLNNVVKVLSAELHRLGAEVFDFYRANPKTAQFDGQHGSIPIMERSSLVKAFFYQKLQRLQRHIPRDNELITACRNLTLFAVPVQMQAEQSCWEEHSCNDKVCRCHSRFKRPCWTESGLRFKGTNAASYEDKAQHCLRCKSFLPVGFFLLKARRPSRMLTFLNANFRGLLRDAVLYDQAYIGATRDSMTGVFNKMSFLLKLAEHLQLSSRYGHNLSLAMLDIDHFKKFNDTYGHQTGDFILKEMATVMSSSVRETDMVARYGGEEFAIIFTVTDKNSALAVADKVRRTIEAHKFQSPEHGELRITISMGIASAPIDDIESVEDLIGKADIALYHAKTTRNACSGYNKNSPSMPKKT